MSVIPSRKKISLRILRAAVGLLIVVSVGGVALAVAERVSVREGLTLAFSTVSTTGFGAGPQTSLGLALTMLVFASGAVCWFSIIVAAFESGIRRSRTTLGANGHQLFEQNLGLRVAPRRPGGDG